jgi:hypothetical protein
MKRVRRRLQLHIPTGQSNDRYGEQLLKKSPLKKRKAETTDQVDKRLHTDSSVTNNPIPECRNETEFQTPKQETCQIATVPGEPSRVMVLKGCLQCGETEVIFDEC